MRTIPFIGGVVCLSVLGLIATAGVRAETPPSATGLSFPTLEMTQAPQSQPAAKQPAAKPGEPAAKPAVKEEAANKKPEAPASKPVEAYGYRGVSSFFNIREAYSNVDKGEWEFEITSIWNTRSNHKHDEVELTQSLKYGITDDFHVELGISEPLGDGGRGVPELNLRLFNTFWHETDWVPAFGGWAELRIPTGYESSGVDGTFGGILTKTLFPRFRAHFQGYVRTANGAQGGFDEARRAFQWGLGPGFDYQITDDTLAVLNYLHKASDDYGQHNNNLLEWGLVHYFPKTGYLFPIYGRFTNFLKFAVDIGLDGLRETPNLGLKLQWGIQW